MAEKNQVILGVEAWDLTNLQEPRVLDFTGYRAEDDLSTPQIMVDKYKQMAVDFINTEPFPNLCFQIEWVDLETMVREISSRPES